MRWKEVLSALVAGLALVTLAAEKPVPPSIDKLVEQLGSDTFAARNDASRQLDAIGAPALPALEKAARSGDAEVRKRASELATRISSRIRAAALLTPTMIHLVFKDTPLKEAVASFGKQAKTSFNLIDPENKLRDKKITLDTGKVTFWVALAKFCAAADLCEADPSRDPKSPIKGRVPAPPVGVPVGPFPPPAGGVFPPGPPIPGVVAFPIMTGYRHGTINLIAGKAAPSPTDARSSIRVRVAPAAVSKPAAPAKALGLMLQAAPESRLRWQRLAGINIEKAIDEHGQNLTRFEQPTPMGGGGGGKIVIGGGVVVFGMGPAFSQNSWSTDGINHDIPLLLTRGEKVSKKLKELAGSLAVVFLEQPRPFIVAENVMKAAGKTFKGGKSGSITINKVETGKGGLIRIEFEFDQPTGVAPENEGPELVPGAGPGKRPLFIRPGVRILPAPGGPGLPAPAIGVWRGPISHANAGLTLQDATGKILPATFGIGGGRVGGAIGARPRFTWTASYRPRKGQPAEPARLVFTGRASTEINVPFKLEGIDLK